MNIAPIPAAYNGNEIVEVFQSQMAFTNSTDKKPVLATYGCYTCLAVAGYDPTNEMAFLAHFSNAAEIRETGMCMINWNISKFATKKIEAPIQLHLRGGVKRRSEDIVESFKNAINSSNSLPGKEYLFEIASEDTLGSGGNMLGDSLAIDSRTGKVSQYDPKANPNARDISKQEIWSALSGVPFVRLVHTPTV